MNSPRQELLVTNTVADAVEPVSSDLAAQTTRAAIHGSVVLLECDLAGVPTVSAAVVIERSGRLKFLVGLDSSKQLVVVFDDLVDLHNDLAKLYDLRPVGGGWLEIDLPNKRLLLSERSLAHGREPDRELTVGMLSRALPEFTCAVAETEE
jgi:hypothetical protein